ncbi:receptor-like protein 12 [Durio zibethinus]|uniref:Receptor-like protein 12 n=1 Tax=Durio zibethinus TaxID=66656 RepID=A0A6P5X1L8_DURZI|nr:receptor-like protein 12 [Durio zibethinus]
MEPKWLLLSVLLLLLEGCRWYSTDACWEEERITLLQLKPFFNPHNDLNSWVDEIKGSDCCQWDRVECNTSSSFSSKRVIGLSLNNTRWFDDERWYLNASLFLPFKELKHLYLTGNNIAGFVESEGLNNLTNLKNLDLSSNRIESFQPSKQGKEMQLRMTNLEVLDLSSNLFKNDTFAFLSGLPSLKSLNMGDNQLQGSIDIEGLNNLTNLKNLDLSSNRIESFQPSKQGKEMQLRMTNLEVLDLSSNLFKNDTFAFLSGLPSLKSLNMGDNQLKGSIDIEGLNNLTNLKNLDLSSNRIESFQPSKQGKEMQLRMTNLEVLDLSSNLFKNDTFAFLSGLPSLKSLNMGDNQLKGSIDIEGLNNLTNLKNLDLSSNRIESFQPSKQGKEMQLRMTNLEVLDLSSNLFKNDTFAFLSGLPSLKSLSMRDNQLQGSIDIDGLNNLTNLKNLDLSSNRIESFQPSKQGKEMQLRMTNLEVLDLSSNLFKNDTFAFLSGLPSLKSLNMGDNQLQGSIDIEDSGRQLNLTHLEEFDLSGNLIKDSIFALLSGLSNLKYLDISSNQLNGSIDMKDLGAFINLEELDMSSNDLNEFVACKEYKSLKKLEVLCLNGVFTNGSIPLLLKLVEAFPSVKSFYLRENCLNKTMVTQDQELHVWNNVEKIFLDKSYLDNNVLQSIGVFTSLKTLSLHNCGLIGSLPNQGWCDLRKLETLDISWNALEGILPYCLGNLTSLIELDISYNQFTGSLTPLANLSSLRFISFSTNHFQISMPFLSLANLPNLKILLGDENKMIMEPNPFHASIPKFQLNIISLSNCTTDKGLSLQPPNFLYYQYDLIYVDLSHNNFSGTVPLWLSENNKKLGNLLLLGNSFTGLLLLSQFLNPHMSLIDISNNKLQGQIPTNICSTFPNLEFLFLSKNAIKGNIPPCLGGMNTLSVLDLSDNHLSGRVPEELIMRSSLGILRLSNNNLSGMIVPMMFNTSKLSNLYLDGNNFAGEILDIDVSATDFSHSSLEEIDLSNNSFNGKLPRWIGNVSYLKRLALSNNHFKGSIPMDLCNLYKLEFLELSQNNLSGSIPSCFNTPYLRHVHLKRNKLRGLLPLAFNSSSLVTLDLRGNNLTGNIPKWISTLSALSVLLLKDNHLDGGIPVQLCKLYSLSIVDLSGNMFSGPIPSFLGNLTLAMNKEKSFVDNSWYIGYTLKDLSISINSLGYPKSYMVEEIEFTTKSMSYTYGGDILEYMSGIDLSCNKLTGQIPLELGNLSEIHSLNLSHNNLIGVIPSSFSKLKQIESLDLSYNNLTGRIPVQLVELNFLEVFSVAHNNLSGNIPKPKAQFGTFDERSYEGNPLLCGAPLQNNCSKTESPSTAPTTADDEGEGISVVLYINPYWRQAWFSFIESCITTYRYSIQKMINIYGRDISAVMFLETARGILKGALVLEPDSKVAVSLIFAEIDRLLEIIGEVKFVHIFKEANYFADSLARKGGVKTVSDQ